MNLIAYYAWRKRFLFGVHSSFRLKPSTLSFPPCLFFSLFLSLSLSFSFLPLESQIKSPLKRPTLRSRLSQAVSFRGSLVSWPTAVKYHRFMASGYRAIYAGKKSAIRSNLEPIVYCRLCITVRAMKYELQLHFLRKS